MKKIRTRRKILFILVVLGFNAILLETACQAAFRWRTGSWFWFRQVPPPAVFRSAPYVAAVGKPNVKVVESSLAKTTSHNSLGFRGPEIPCKNADSIRIVTLGGSTTYCTQISDDQTWPVRLAGFLGPRYEVINLGMAGYSTVENLIQANLWFSDLKPDIAVFYEGWNDMCYMHIKGLMPDYSNSNGGGIKWTVPFTDTPRHIPFLESWSACLYYAYHAYNRIRPVPYPEPERDATASVIDERTISLYQRNLHLIAATCKAQNVRCVFVPQILNFQAILSDLPYDWIPSIQRKDAPEVLARYNETMRSVAKEENIVFVEEMLATPFTLDDFVDNGHLSPKGTEKFAKVLAPSLLQTTGSTPLSGK